MKIGSEKLGDEVAKSLQYDQTESVGHANSHIFQWGDEDVAEGDDLVAVSPGIWDRDSSSLLTFSWRRCFRSFNSRYVRLDRTGVEKGFMIFLTATGCWVNWSLAEL